MLSRNSSQASMNRRYRTDHCPSQMRDNDISIQLRRDQFPFKVCRKVNFSTASNSLISSSGPPNFFALIHFAHIDRNNNNILF